LVCGFGGMRDYAGELSFDPRLPADWPSLSFPLQWQGSALQVTLTKDELRITVRSGDPVPFTVRDQAFIATVDDAVVVPLADQGPLIKGRPSLGQIGDALREDGTLLSASVPVITTSIPVIEPID
jgi:alpha,alpha-trehalose phosphorylase